MKNIKFRAWDNECGKMFNDLTINNIINQTIEGLKDGDDFGHWLSVTDHILMQFTGLKGKNGVEIYEGDICNFKTVALFESKRDVVNYFRGGYQIGEYYLSHINHLTIRVIGNIYETPELLK